MTDDHVGDDNMPEVDSDTINDAIGLLLKNRPHFAITRPKVSDIR